ncbi:hypothetical protein [Shewanella sp. T24-MNA-CIBAN-0130]|uniref:hypothetical protein n=1 Tax=Shewanella sp. T24-MNA-CIBAN-0130 TaxID=3140470 RepID=UPI00333215CF
MSQLTQKQIKARAYYQANRERILEQKRGDYQPASAKPAVMKVTRSKTAEQPKQPTKADIEWDGMRTAQHQFNSVINVDAEFKDRKAINQAISDQGKVKAAARRKAEDMKLARELGLSLEDLA